MTKMTIDGNTAVGHVAYAFSDVAAIYPITPSSPMAEVSDEWAANGRKNLFGQTVRIAEMQSEARRCGRGSRLSGGWRADHDLHRVPGPAADDPQHVQDLRRAAAVRVPRISARALAAHALSIFGDHSDVMACSSDRLCHAGLQLAYRKSWTWRWLRTWPR